MFDQLQIMADRYEELGGLLSDPEVVNDTKRFMALSKEEASLRETVAAYARYVEVTTGISDAEEMLSDSSLDADEADMFKEELKALKAEKATLEEDIKILFNEILFMFSLTINQIFIIRLTFINIFKTKSMI